MFPQFNIYSTPLLILALQGLLFGILLLLRYGKEKQLADLFIGLLLIIIAWHRTTYVIGFMGWYDTYQNTKINYFLFNFTLAVGPLIYFYVRSLLVAQFQFGRKDWLHFLPVGVYFLYRLLILWYDSGQSDWNVGYEGEWQRTIHTQYVSPVLRLLEYSSQLLYLAFTIQLFVLYRQKIRQYFSNTFQVELNWIRLFLIVYSILFVYDSITDIIDAFIVELHYTNKWWVGFAFALAIVFLGVKAYFTNLKRLHDLTFEIKDPHDPELEPEVETEAHSYEKQMKKLSALMEREQAYLKPDYTLRHLAEDTGMNINEVSEVINAGFGYNFNEFINRYRVVEVKKRLLDPQNAHLSILAIAFDSGFNSKASFNRIFKQLTGQTPSQFVKDHKK